MHKNIATPPLDGMLVHRRVNLPAVSRRRPVPRRPISAKNRAKIDDFDIFITINYLQVFTAVF